MPGGRHGEAHGPAVLPGGLAARARGAPGRTETEGLAAQLDCLSGSHSEQLGRLLGAVALEELALARLLQVEAGKSERVAGRISAPFSPDELVEFQKSLTCVLAEVVKKEELLLRKLRLVLALLDAFPSGDDGDDPCGDDPFEPEKVDEVDEDDEELERRKEGGEARSASWW